MCMFETRNRSACFASGFAKSSHVCRVYAAWSTETRVAALVESCPYGVWAVAHRPMEGWATVFKNTDARSGESGREVGGGELRKKAGGRGARVQPEARQRGVVGEKLRRAREKRIVRQQGKASERARGLRFRKASRPSTSTHPSTIK